MSPKTLPSTNNHSTTKMIVSSNIHILCLIAFIRNARQYYRLSVETAPLCFVHNCIGSETWTLLKADEQRLEAFHMNCQRRILGIRWFHFVTNASVTSQTGEEGLAIRICRRRLSIFGHVRQLPEATPAHSTLRLAVDARTGVKPRVSTNLAK